MWPFLVAAAISSVGTILKANAEGRAGDEAQAAAHRNAKLAQEAAGDALQRAKIVEMRAQAKGNAVIAEQRTETSGSGVDVNTGTSADIALQTQQFTDLDREIIRNDAWREAYGLNSRVQGFEQAGAYAAAASRYDQLGTFIGGIGQVAGIVGSRYNDIPKAG